MTLDLDKELKERLEKNKDKDSPCGACGVACRDDVGMCLGELFISWDVEERHREWGERRRIRAVRGDNHVGVLLFMDGSARFRGSPVGFGDWRDQGRHLVVQ